MVSTSYNHPVSFYFTVAMTFVLSLVGNVNLVSIVVYGMGVHLRTIVARNLQVLDTYLVVVVVCNLPGSQPLN